ncbi:MAG: acyl carrier protein, partial [Bacteriovorax sp.]|nr:acyl carrier protein [Rhizobacter sp.]
TFETLRTILIREYQLAPDTLTMDAALEGLGIDSLGVAELLFSVEDEFGISLPPEPLQLLTLGDVVRFIDDLLLAQKVPLHAAPPGTLKVPLEAVQRTS